MEITDCTVWNSLKMMLTGLFMLLVCVVRGIFEAICLLVENWQTVGRVVLFAVAAALGLAGFFVIFIEGSWVMYYLFH